MKRIFAALSVCMLLAGCGPVFAGDEVSLTIDLGQKRIVSTNAIAFREVVPVRLVNIGTASPSNLVFRLTDNDGATYALTDGFATSAPITLVRYGVTSVYSTATGSVDLNTSELAEYFTNRNVSFARSFQVGVWDTGRGRLLVSDRLEVRNNPYRPGAPGPSPIRHYYLTLSPDSLDPVQGYIVQYVGGGLWTAVAPTNMISAGSGGIWGNVIGDLTNQVDLWNWISGLAASGLSISGRVSVMEADISTRADSGTVYTAIGMKANSNTVFAAIGTRADSGTVYAAIGTRADSGTVYAAIGTRADSGTVYTAIGTRADSGTVYAAIGTRADSGTVYAAIGTKADSNTVFAAIGTRADSGTVYAAISALVSAISTKADSNTVYGLISNLVLALNEKADSNTVFTALQYKVGVTNAGGFYAATDYGSEPYGLKILYPYGGYSVLDVVGPASFGTESGVIKWSNDASGSNNLTLGVAHDNEYSDNDLVINGGARTVADSINLSSMLASRFVINTTNFESRLGWSVSNAYLGAVLSSKADSNTIFAALSDFPWWTKPASNHPSAGGFGISNAHYIQLVGDLGNPGYTPPLSLTVSNSYPAWKTGGGAYRLFFGQWNFDTGFVWSTIGTKADSGTVYTALGTRADSGTVYTAIGTKADSGTVYAAIGTRADSGTVYTAIGTRADSSTVYAAIGTRADSGTVYTAIGTRADSNTVYTAIDAIRTSLQWTNLQSNIVLIADEPGPINMQSIVVQSTNGHRVGMFATASSSFLTIWDGRSTFAPVIRTDSTGTNIVWSDGGGVTRTPYHDGNFSPSSYTLYQEFLNALTNCFQVRSGVVTGGQAGVWNRAILVSQTNLMIPVGGTNWVRFQGVLNP
jgi:hypothetical protein